MNLLPSRVFLAIPNNLTFMLFAVVKNFGQDSVVLVDETIDYSLFRAGGFAAILCKMIVVPWSCW